MPVFPVAVVRSLSAVYAHPLVVPQLLHL
jgi:hypothetical protein